MAAKPVSIKASKSEGMLRIEWEDGLQSEYPLEGLRAACPCAECKGGHANMGQPGAPEMLEGRLDPGKSAALERLELVGNYALQLVWSDGHSYGIYTWEYLRALSPQAP
jgi:DUF971 family protein